MLDYFYVRSWIKTKVNNLRARLIRKYRIREITKVLMVAHAAELAQHPGEQWPLIRDRQAREILAVQEGKLDIVDRRSWQFPYLPETLHRIKQPIIKNLPYNVRRFSRTPVPRRAINVIKSSIVNNLEWDIRHKIVDEANYDDDTKQRIAFAKKCFEHPNNVDSFQSFNEAGIDDMCVNGAFCIEPRITPDPERPFKMWAVDSSTIRMFPDWKESAPDQPRFAQMTGLKGERGIIIFYDDELIYLKDNPQVDTPFGLGKMEVAFHAVNSFLGVQEMAGRAGSDQIHKTWLWWEQSQAPHNIDVVRRHIMNDLEGQSKLSLIAGMKAPTVIEVQPVTVEDLLLEWQEMLIRMIANAFDMSAMALNLERDVNRATGEVLDDRDFRSAVVPMARRIEEGFTRFILHRLLGWTDLEFYWKNLDDPDAQTKMTLLQQAYVCNAETPNGIRKAMGKPPLANKFADLTQFECLLIQTEAQGKIQEKAAQNNFSRQMYQTSMMQPPGGEEPQDEATAAASTTGGLKQPKLPALKMPKLPGLKTPKLPSLPGTKLAGSIYNAREVAAMSLSEIKSAVAKGHLPKNKKFLAQQMEMAEPGILEELTEEIIQYFKHVQDEAESDDQDEDPKATPEHEAKQKEKFKKTQHVPSEIERNVIHKGVNDNAGRIPRLSQHGFRGKNYNQGFEDKRSGKGVEIDHNPPYQKKPRRKS